MALDSRYIVAPSIQTLFRDKDTGQPMSDGYVYFYRDVDRNALKPVYQLVGTPGNYSYQALPNPVPLNSIGTYSSNSADDIEVYMYPYLSDGTTVDLYYIKVFNSDDIEQFDRQAQPPGVIPGGGTSGTEAENFIANGQFNLHLIPPGNTTADPVIPEGQITQAVTNIAYGGWTFERPNASTSVDIISFVEDSTYSTTPPNNPRFRLQVENTSGGVGDLFKDIRIKFQDVNRFSSDTQFYTLGFTARSESLSNVNITVLIYKFYGSGVGASLPSTTNITNLTLTPSDTAELVPFVFGNNTGKVITGGDDYVSIVIRLPLNSAFSMSMVDAFLYKENVTDAIYPTTTTRQDLYRSLVGSNTNPSYTGFDLYLPIRYGQNGIEPDDSLVSKIFSSMSATPDVGELLCNGDQYETLAYSSDGIPYARLQAKLFDATAQMPITGTGPQYFVMLQSAASTAILNNNGTSVVVTATSDGAVPTNFTFRTVHQSQATGFEGVTTTYDTAAYFYSDTTVNDIILWNTYIGEVTNEINAGTSPLSVGTFHNNPEMRYRAAINTVPGSSFNPAGGEYFTFDALDSTAVNRGYYVWFTVDGVGTDPAVGGRTGIKCQIEAADTQTIVNQKIIATLNGVQSTYITFQAASTLTGGGQYFLCSSAGNAAAVNYLVWYKVAGVGTEPVVAGRTNIRVDLPLGTETAAEVMQITQLAINSKFFAVPDLRGYILRGWDPTMILDQDGRLSQLGANDHNIGTIQTDQIYSHHHTVEFTNPETANGIFQFAVGPFEAGGPGNTYDEIDLTAIAGLTGGYESRPYNFSVNFVIKY